MTLFPGTAPVAQEKRTWRTTGKTWEKRKEGGKRDAMGKGRKGGREKKMKERKELHEIKEDSGRWEGCSVVSEIIEGEGRRCQWGRYR